MLNGKQQQLEKRWYDSLEAGHPDYGIYSDDAYFDELKLCFKKYSSRYLKDITKFIPSTIRTIVDLGCGTGETCVVLKQLFPNAKVCGTNIPGTRQYELCKFNSEQNDFILAPGISELPIESADLLFASEYFEHIGRPLEHLEVIMTLLTPTYMVIANSFNTRAAGHFLEYKDGPDTIACSRISRMFNSFIKDCGLTRIKTGLWNDRPAYWRREL